MTMICSGIFNSSQLMDVTKAMKGLVLEKFLLLRSFQMKSDQSTDLNETNEVFSEEIIRERLPTRWLSALRVKELDIQHASLSSCFMCDEPFTGQSDFLVSLLATHSSLDGHLCNTCNTPTKSVSLRELSKVPRLKYLDLSWNDIEVIDGMAFPVGMDELSEIRLAHNKINRIYDNAFSILTHLTSLDLSNNELATISRRVFRANHPLQTLDLSWNSLQTLPEGIFNDLRNLKELKVSYNLFEVLPSNTWTRIPANIERVDFSGNFLVCNCTMSWISRLVGRPSTKVNGKCAYPSEVESQELKSSLTSLRSCS